MSETDSRDAIDSGSQGSRKLEDAAPTRDSIVRGVIEDVVTKDDDSEARQLRRLSIAIKNSLGRFSLLFAVCNSSVRRRSLIATLTEILPPLNISTITLTKADRNIVDRLLVDAGPADVLMVAGIEELLPSDDKLRTERTLRELQLRREQFRELARPCVLWMPEYVYALLGRSAVDFWSWQSGGFHFDRQSMIATGNDFLTSESVAFSRHRLFRPLFFVGRTEQLNRAVLALNQGQSVAIVGAAGVGKSSFMRQVADQARTLFDLVVQVDLLGLAQLRGDQVVSAALSAIIRRLSPDSRIPEEIAPLTALYRTILDRRRALILIDDVPPDFPVRALRPPHGSALVVTSRSAVRDADFLTLQLDYLSTSDAGDLLQHLAPTLSVPQVQQLVSLTEGSPLVIHLIGDAIARGGITPEELADNAARGKFPRPLALDDLLSRTYDSLPQSAARTLRLMTVFPGSFDSEAEVSVCLDHDGLVATELLRHSLVYLSEATNRYGMHDLVREFARRKIDPSEHTEAAIRHARHYLGVIERAYRELQLDQTAGETVRDQVEEELENIRTACIFVATHSDGHQVLADLCVRYADACESFSVISQRTVKWKELVMAAVGASNDPSIKARNLGRLGRVLTSEGNLEEAYRSYVAQFETASEGNDRRSVAEALGNLGSTLHAAGKLEAASQAYTKQLEITAESDDVGGRVKALANLAAVFYSLGQFDHSEEVSTVLLETARKTNDPRPQVSALNNLSLIALERGDLEKARSFSEEQIRVSQQIGDASGELIALSNCGHVLSRLRDYQGAIMYYEMALRMSQAVGDLLAQQRLFSSLGRVYVAVGQRDRAADLLERALAIARELSDRGGELAVLNSLGELYSLAGDARRADDAYWRALSIARDLGDKRLESVALMNMSEQALSQGDRTRARETIEAAKVALGTLSDDDASSLRRSADRWSLAIDSYRLAEASVSLLYPLLPLFRGSLDDARVGIAASGEAIWQAAHTIFKLLQKRKDLAPMLGGRKAVRPEQLTSTLADILSSDVSLAYYLSEVILGARVGGSLGQVGQIGPGSHINVGGDIVGNVVITGEGNTVGTVSPEFATPVKQSQSAPQPK